MGKLRITPCEPIEGLYIIEPQVFGDERGYFFESYNERDMHEAGLDLRFVQDNESMSQQGVLRGLHYQIRHPQGKIVRALQGRVFDVVVDIREGSKTFGRWFGVELNDENHRQLYISPGFAHGYLTLSKKAVFAYKVTDFYHPEDEGGLLWNDPDIGIHWPEVDGLHLTDGTPLLINVRDQKWPGIADLRRGK